MANIIKKAVFDFFDKTLAQEGYVLAVRKWEPASMYEIDLHLPETDLGKWKTIPRLKIKVAEFEYRDYSPAIWNVERKTCTILIETGHKGAGSAWVENLNTGEVFLFGPAHAAPLPPTAGKVLCLGDGSALGHFMALKLLTDREKNPLDVIMFLSEEYKIPESIISAYPEFEFIKQSQGNSLSTLKQWCTKTRNLSEFSVIYLAGYIPMVKELRKMFKNDSNVTAKILANGFWS
ncbi:hypothetical protein [Pedobacter antarcticus]|uniref:hypothetical protein n=1 Tax=Pedobacter antarcticus TaxID=34086 RepID=UPI001C58D9BA|nr:hypothetical protein [Pedobacter antarcticus]